MKVLSSLHTDIRQILDQKICYTACSKLNWSPSGVYSRRKTMACNQLLRQLRKELV